MMGYANGGWEEVGWIDDDGLTLGSVPYIFIKPAVTDPRVKDMVEEANAMDRIKKDVAQARAKQERSAGRREVIDTMRNELQERLIALEELGRKACEAYGPYSEDAIWLAGETAGVERVLEILTTIEETCI